MRNRLVAPLLLVFLLLVPMGAAAAEETATEAPTETAAEGVGGDDATSDGATETAETTPPPTEAPAEPEPDRAPPGDDGDSGGAPDATGDGNDEAEESGDEATDTPATADTDADEPGHDESDSTMMRAAAVSLDDIDVSIVQIPLDEICELSGRGVGSFSNRGTSLQAAPGASLPPAGSAARADLLAALDATVARFPDAGAIVAIFDGSRLVVLVLPDVANCPGFPGGEFPDEPGAEEIEIIELTEEEVCAAIAEGELLPEELAVPDDDELREFLPGIDIQDAGALTPEQRKAVGDLAGELDGLLAEHPRSDVLQVLYEPSLGLVLVLLVPTEVGCLPATAPIAPPVPPAAVAAAGTAPDLLPETGADASSAAATALLSTLIGAALVTGAGRLEGRRGSRLRRLVGGHGRHTAGAVRRREADAAGA